MHIESGGMGSYDVSNAGFTWKRYKRCLVASLTLFRLGGGGLFEPPPPAKSG